MHRRASGANTPVGRLDWLSVTFLLGAVLLLYYLVPLVSLFGAEPPGAVLARMGDPDVVSATRTSIVAALVSTALATTFGVPLAYWLARTEGRLSTVVTAVAVLPLVLPPIVSGMVLLTVIGPNTLLGDLASTVGVPLTRSLAGVVLAQTFVASPFVVVTAKAAFEGVDDDLEYAARSLGTSRFTTFARVTLPLAWPGILAGITLAFARALGEFGATIMLAYYPRSMPVEIWVSFTTVGLEKAFPLAVILVGVAVVTIVLVNLVGRHPLE